LFLDSKTFKRGKERKKEKVGEGRGGGGGGGERNGGEIKLETACV
jgi:hypothetical protein